MSTNQRRTEEKLTVQQMEDRIILFRGNITQAEKIISLRAHPGWQEIMTEVNESLERIEFALDKFEQTTKTDVERVILLKERKDLKYWANMIDNAERNLKANYEAIDRLQKEINEQRTAAPAARS